MDKAARIRKAFADGEGVIRMVPNFVPRSFNQPGRRLKLHPDDYYAKGMDRGAITERWFSSVCPAANGPLAPEDEVTSYVSLYFRFQKRYRCLSAGAGKNDKAG